MVHPQVAIAAWEREFTDVLLVQEPEYALSAMGPVFQNGRDRIIGLATFAVTAKKTVLSAQAYARIAEGPEVSHAHIAVEPE